MIRRIRRGTVHDDDDDVEGGANLQPQPYAPYTHIFLFTPPPTNFLPIGALPPLKFGAIAAFNRTYPAPLRKDLVDTSELGNNKAIYTF